MAYFSRRGVDLSLKYKNASSRQRFWDNLSLRDKKLLMDERESLNVRISGRDFRYLRGKDFVLYYMADLDYRPNSILVGKFNLVDNIIGPKDIFIHRVQIPKTAWVTIEGRSNRIYADRVIYKEKVHIQKDQVREFLDAMKHSHGNNDSHY